MDEQLYRALTRAAEQCVGDFNAHDLRMILWALMRPESLRDAWTLFGRAKLMIVSLSPLGFAVLLMECEQRGLCEHEIASRF